MQPLGFALEGHPTPACNGVYRKVSEHKGWPVLRNGAGAFCYRYELDDKWFLRKEHTPDSAICNSSIASAEGLLPCGAQTWQCNVDGEFVDRSLSVTVLVRPFPSLMPSALVCISSVSLSRCPVTQTMPSSPTPTQPYLLVRLPYNALLLPL
eukprot:COSAG06_NODE_8339_length_2199_cov_5.181429_5_plen_152_part_00